jgi:hypothetical protein
MERSYNSEKGTAQMRDMTEPLDTYEDQGDYDWDYDDVEDRGPRPKVLWGRVISLVVFMLIAFLIGRMSKDGGVDEAEFQAVVDEQQALEDQVTTLQEENDSLQALIDNQNNAGGGGNNDPEEEESDPASADDTLEPKVHTVQPGETLSVIIKKEYGCVVAESGGNEVDLTENVTDTNTADDPSFDPALLAAGQDILLPPLPSGYSCP